MCPEVDLLESHGMFFKLRVSQETVSLGDLYQSMEVIKSRLNLAYYSISKPGLG